MESEFSAVSGKRKRAATQNADFDYEEEEPLPEKKRREPAPPRVPKPTIKLTVTQPLLELTPEEKRLLSHYASLRALRAADAERQPITADSGQVSQHDKMAKAEEATKAALAMAISQASAEAEDTKPVHRGPSRRLAPPSAARAQTEGET